MSKQKRKIMKAGFTVINDKIQYSEQCLVVDNYYPSNIVVMFAVFNPIIIMTAGQSIGKWKFKSSKSINELRSNILKQS